MISNCLFEAVKAKLKDPRNVKIYLYPPRINDGKVHFYWTNGEQFYHFIKDDKKSILLFEGHVKESGAKLFYSFMGHRIYTSGLNKEQAYQLAKKYRLPFTRDDINDIWFNEEND